MLTLATWHRLGNFCRLNFCSKRLVINDGYSIHTLIISCNLIFDAQTNSETVITSKFPKLMVFQLIIDDFTSALLNLYLSPVNRS